MKKNLIKCLIVGVISFLFVGCDTTKELVVFEENIGMPDSMLGTYKVTIKDSGISGDTGDMSICYEKGKYHFFIIGSDQTVTGYAYGTFVPSRVEGTKNYYIMSFPELRVVSYYHLKKDSAKLTFNNVLLNFKKEGNTIMSWEKIFQNNLLSQNLEYVKNNIKKSYTMTFVKDPFIIVKKSSECSGDIEKDIKQIDIKYKDYLLFGNNLN